MNNLYLWQMMNQQLMNNDNSGSLSLFSFVGAKSIPLHSKSWAGGEEHIFIDAMETDLWNPIIHASVQSSSDVMRLVLLVDAIREINMSAQIELRMPYMPYARQDRVCNRGEALAVRSMARIINMLGFSKVTIWDAHSDVAPALLDNCNNIHVSEVIDSFSSQIPALLDVINSFVLVAPDAGASKKVHAVAARFKTTYRTASKKRSSDGAITDTQFDFGGLDKSTDLLICDDICDGGRTFIQLANAIREARGGSKENHGEIALYVTHGIFSYGYEALFNAGIGRIFTANNIRDGEFFTVTTAN